VVSFPREVSVTTKRKLIPVVAVLVVAIVAGPLGLRLGSQGPEPVRFIDQEQCDRIKRGMKQAEVEVILGRSPGTYTKKQIYFLFLDAPNFSMLDPGCRVEQWTDDQARVDVVFDEQGAVVFSHYEKGIEWRSPSYPEQIQNWLRSSMPPPPSGRSPKTFTTEPESPSASP
jgi:hypothetical protein